MVIYLDADYKCYVTDDGTMRPYETDFFDGKCQAYIEGYRLVPEGETWTKTRREIISDEVEYEAEVVEATFLGLMISPWKPLAELDAAQAAYEDVLNEAEKAYEEGVNTAYEQ